MIEQICRSALKFRAPLRRLALIALVVWAAVPAAPAAAADDAAPRAVVDGFYRTLVGVMKQGKTLGFDGRFKRLQPAVESAFNLPKMTRLAVGPYWQDLSADKQAVLAQAFARFSTASYASNFDDFGGEVFEVVGSQPYQSGRLIVETKLTPKGEDAVKLNYLMEDGGEGWKIIDVFLQGTISQLAAYRSEFTSVMRRDGYDGLTAILAKKVEDLQAKK
ncbi:MAG: hypothetical protein GC191_19825 [Azospirillum sp.]|nr:hypothetical protein [Azospirillum sp.]